MLSSAVSHQCDVCINMCAVWTGIQNSEDTSAGIQKRQEMSSDLHRQDSLRTVLRNQKRRLSATDRKQSSPDLTRGNGERKSPFSLRNTPARSQRGTPTISEKGTPTRSTFTPPKYAFCNYQISNIQD